jgi:hypothetical protein
MRFSAYLCVFLLAVSQGCFFYASQGNTEAAPFDSTSASAILPVGETAIKAARGEQTAAVSICAVRVDRSDVAFPSSGPLSEDLLGIKEITIVKEVKISLDGHKLFVPYSVYADLINPSKATVGFKDGMFVLTIQGGDAAWSYFLDVYFDAKQVHRRSYYWALVPDKPAQETRYWLRKLKDVE